MMLANVYSKSIRDRYIGWLIGASGLLLMTLGGTFVYRDLDGFVQGMLDTFPDSVLSLLGLTGVSDASSYMITAIFTTYGPFIVIGLAIAMGTAAVAGEERDGTFGILHSNPLSRSKTVQSQCAGLLTLTVVCSAVISAGMWLVGISAGLDMSGIDLFAAGAHLALTALTYGMLALAIGALTGNASLTSGITTGFLILSFFAAGVLPLVGGIAWLARVFPWYYMNYGQPINNGTVWSSLAILAAVSAVLFGLAIIGVNRRDIRSGESTGTVKDRLAQNARLAGIVRRLEGSGPSVSSVWMKTFTESRLLMVLVGMGIGYLALLEGPLYNLLDDVLLEFGNSFPQQLLAIIGVSDISSPEGWIGAEMFSIVAPAAAIVLGVSIGSRALGGEQDRGSMDALLANPISRTRVVTEKTVALLGALMGLGFLTFLGTWAGIALGGLGIPVANIAAVSAHLAALGFVFGGFALLIGAATGKGKTANAVAAGIAVATYVLNAFGTANPGGFGWLRDLSPFGYYTGSNPLVNGVDYFDLGVLAGLSVVFIGLGVAAFNRADIRN